MAETGRKFRTEESFAAEREARQAIVPFLKQRGFLEVEEQLTFHGTAISQRVTARDGPEGPLVKMHVHLCWRRGGRKESERLYSAAQLRARLTNNSWDDTLDSIVERDLRDAVTHKLIVQYDEGEFAHAALIPTSEVKSLWQRQREVSDQLIQSGKTGRRRKNHAANGDSPTIYLKDDRTADTHVVADVVWSWPGVINLLSGRGTGPALGIIDDTFDDCPTEGRDLGRDTTEKVVRLSSGYPRDPRVRAAVIQRSKGTCERDGCGERRDYPAFLDVHHILGIGVSDRPWNCVALCPNCHREAHFAPDRDRINASLAEFASRFRDL